MEIIDQFGGAGEIVRNVSVLAVLLFLIYCLLTGRFVVARWTYDDRLKYIEKLESTLEQRDRTANEATSLARQMFHGTSQSVSDADYPTRDEVDSMRRDIANLRRSNQDRQG